MRGKTTHSLCWISNKLTKAPSQARAIVQFCKRHTFYLLRVVEFAENSDVTARPA